MTAPERYRSLRPWLLETFGRPVHRVALDAGSSCPNRDGSRGRGGCVYCDVEGSGTGALESGSDLREQLEQGIRRVARRAPDCGVIAYLQSYSNTYVAPERLDEVLGAIEARLGDPIVCVAIATRPDTLPDHALARLARLRERVPVWVELGLEAADDGVLRAINRLHGVDEFHDAVARCRAHGLLTVGHAILGLPGDGKEGPARTARALARAGVEGVKVHHLMVLRRTQLAAWWREGRVEPLTVEAYVELLADFVEHLRPDQVLHRITGDAAPEDLLAPLWDVHNNEVRGRLDAELARRGTRQGARYGRTPDAERARQPSVPR
jgi:radical SAM protein (TIGR01212 family)